MIIRDVLASASNTTCVYAGDDYINFNSIGPGAVFYQNGVDVSAGVSAIDSRSFIDNMQIACDDNRTLADEIGNVYFKIDKFIIIQTSLPISNLSSLTVPDHWFTKIG